MPCRNPEDDVRVLYENGVDPQYKLEAERLSARCQELTQLLCEAGRARKGQKCPLMMRGQIDVGC